jgi:methanol metabolism-related c-type cytochrome
MLLRNRLFAIGVTLSALAGGAAIADEPGDPTAVKSVDGKYFDKDGNPTYKIQADATVDWYTYSGYRRYHSDCHVCHGPDGEGSSYAPALKNSLKRLSYDDFIGIVAGGRRNVSTAQDNVMPAFSDQSECHVLYRRHFYVHLRARANEAIGRSQAGKTRAEARGVHQGGGRLLR